MLDGEGQPGPDTGDTSQGGEAKTTLTGDEAVLAQLESQIESDEVAEGAGDGETQGDQSDDEVEDYEHEGKTYKVPKALKKHLMLDADYTRGKQEVAEARKAAEARQAEIEAEKKFHTENLEVITDIRTIDRQLAAYDKLNWEELLQKDAKQHQYHLGRLQLLERQRNQLIGDLQQKQHQALEKQNAERSKLAEDSLARIAKKIPGWSDELAGKLNEYATSNGFSMDELQGFIPKKNADAYVSTLHKAYLFDQLMARTRAKTKPEAAPVVTVVPNITSRRAPAAKDPNKMSPEEYRTWRTNGGGTSRSAAR